MPISRDGANNHNNNNIRVDAPLAKNFPVAAALLQPIFLNAIIITSVKSRAIRLSRKREGERSK